MTKVASDRVGRNGEVRAPPSGRPIRLVLFDFDDTLFDHTRALVEGLRALRSSQPRLRSKPFARVVGEYERLLELIQPGRPGGPVTHSQARAARFQRLDRWLGGSGDADNAQAWSAEYRAAYQAARTPVPGAVALLRDLKGRVGVGIVTNNHTAEQQEKLAALGLTEWIDFMVTSEAAGVAKPDPAIFRPALRAAGVSPDQATMVGDSWAADIVGARAAGLSAVWLHRWGRRPRGLPEVRELRSLAPLRVARRVLLAPTDAVRSVRASSEPFLTPKPSGGGGSDGQPSRRR